MKLINGRYKIIKELKRGFCFTQYAVEDLIKNRTNLCLYLIEPEYRDSSWVQEYIENYIFFTSIEHEYIIHNESFDLIHTIDNKEVSIGQFFYTTEYVFHKPILYTELPLVERLECFKQLCIILKYLHFRGIIYGHLNPENMGIFRSEKGVTIKLLDMAYITQIKHTKTQMESHQHMFLSPEYQLGSPIDTTSDIYSLGVMLFYLYTGKNCMKFRFKDNYDNIIDKDTRSVIEIIRKMTSYEMGDRPRDITEIISLLQNQDIISPVVYNDKNNYEKLNFKTKLVNREKELEKVLNAIDEAGHSNTKATCFSIQGEYGIGKSRFLKEILYRLRLKNINVYSSIFQDAYDNSYKPYIEVSKQMLKTASNELVEKYGPELIKIIPNMSEVWKIKPSPSLLGEKEKLRLHDRICNFIMDYTAERPTVIIIDNFHYADKYTIELTDLLLKNKKTTPLILILSYRQEETKDLLFQIQQWQSLGRIEPVSLTKFNLEETASLIQNILGMAWKPIKLATRVMNVSDGNPRYIEEVIKNLFMEGLIAINSRDYWIAKVDDLYELQLPSNINEALIKQIEAFDHKRVDILKWISIFNTSVSLEIISGKLYDYSEPLQELLKDLVEMKILNEKLEDWGFTYDYYNRQVKNYIYSSIEEDERKHYHLAAAIILEDNYLKEGRDNKDELIHHLTKCGHVNKAIDYCIESAKKMITLNINSQALEFYNKALSFFSQSEEDNRKTKILLAIGDIHYSMGESEKAFQYYSLAIESALAFGTLQILVDAQNKMSEISMRTQKTAEAKKMLSVSIGISEDIGYIEGFLEATYLLSDLYLKEEDLEEFNKLIEMSLSISIQHKSNHYIGHFLNQKGKLYHSYEDYDEAMMNFIESVEYFEKAGNVFDSLKSVNNMGVVVEECIRDIQLARRYYKKALYTAQKYNYIVGTDIYHMNIGETYLLEDRFEKAILHLDKSIQIANEIGDSGTLFWTYILLCEAYLGTGEYAKAYNSLLKIENSFYEDENNENIYVYLQLIKIKFYFKIGVKDLARKELEKVIAYKDKMDFLCRFATESLILHLEMEEYKAPNKKLEKIVLLVEEVEKTNYIKELRCMLLQEVFDLTHKEEFTTAYKLLLLDQNLEQKFDTDLLNAEKRYLMGFYERNPLVYYENLLVEMDTASVLEIKWRIYQVLGDQYFKQKEYYNAVNCYINALDILKRLIYKVPISFQAAYLNEDLRKKSIRSKLNEIKKIIQDDQEISLNNSMEQWIEVADFFDFSSLQNLFSNKVFLQSALKEFNYLSIDSIENERELISHFTSDYIYNTELILKYCIQITLAQRGFIIIVDTENHVERVIKFDKKHKLPDISHLLERVNLKQEGILIKTRFDTRDYQRLDYLPNNAQAAICIPISARKGDVYGFKTERRKNTVENFEKSIIGYIYLDTDKIFNNFDLKTFNICNVLTNLLYLVIDGYESKISSSIDKVTKVFMRKYFERALKEEMSFSRINGTYFSVVMCDIDKFKAVNDLFGHRKGDEILSRIGEILKENLRQEDIIGRYGGEEFIILLPNTNESESKFVCEKIRKKVENAELLGSKHTVTISFGIASFPEHGYREEELIEKADQALYYAKEKGRNKTVIWTSHISNIQNRTNQLTGIVSCNMLEDYHRIQVMLEITQLLKDNFNINDKLFTLLGRLIEITEARQGTIVTIKENGIDCYYSRERFKQDWIDDVILNHNKIDEIIETKTGVFMIDWELFPSIDSFTGTPDWQSVMLIPLVNKGSLKGILYLSVPIREQEFDFNTFNFMNVLGNIIGAIL